MPRPPKISDPGTLSLSTGYERAADPCALTPSKHLQGTQAAVRWDSSPWTAHRAADRPAVSDRALAPPHQEVDQEDPRPGRAHRRDCAGADAATRAWPRHGYRTW